MGSVKSFLRAGGGIDPIGAQVRNHVAPLVNPNAPTGDSALTLQNVGDPGGFFHAQGPTPGIFDPNAPGSIMNGTSAHGPFINPLTNMRAGYGGAPTPGSPYGQAGAPSSMPSGGATNGLQAQPDWASIIGRALRK